MLRGLLDLGALRSTQDADITLTGDEDETAHKENPTPAPSGTQKTKKVETKAPDTEQKKTEKKQDEPTRLCKFYNRGKCTKRKNCNFDHPQICETFRVFGRVQLKIY